MKINYNILTWLFLTVYVVVAVSFATTKHSDVICNTAKVFITDSLVNGFIDEEDISLKLHEDGMNIMGNSIQNINTKWLEQLLSDDPFVKKSEIYVNIKGEICVEIDQRNPILRIVNNRDVGYYLDWDGCIMPLSDNYSAHVLIANGYIVEHIEIQSNNYIGCEALKDQSGMSTTLCDLHKLAKYIYASEFWRAQVEQIYVNSEGEYELIPRVGAHQILFGSIDHYEQKFRNLKALYEQGLSKKGWNTYKMINLKFENQVICTKR